MCSAQGHTVSLTQIVKHLPSQLYVTIRSHSSCGPSFYMCFREFHYIETYFSVLAWRSPGVVLVS